MGAVITYGGPPRGARRAFSRVILRGHGAYVPAHSHREAIQKWNELRKLERRVVMWQDAADVGDGWRVAVHDGWGQTIDDLAPVPYEYEDAREVARAAVADLLRRGDETDSPWEVVR